MKLPPGEFADLVQRALEDIPEPLIAFMRDVTIDIEPTPDGRVCERAGVGDPRHLLGFYQGTPLTHRSVEHLARLPDRITIYQFNIERLCRSHKQIIQQVRKTVFHEVGHHFGLDEEDLAELGYS